VKKGIFSRGTDQGGGGEKNTTNCENQVLGGQGRNVSRGRKGGKTRTGWEGGGETRWGVGSLKDRSFKNRDAGGEGRTEVGLTQPAGKEEKPNHRRKRRRKHAQTDI